MNLNTEAAIEIIKEINMLEENIKECRLETIPDVDRVRCFEEMLKAKQKELADLQDYDCFAPC